jgi:cyclic pyranopterin phosphate synthase
MTQMDVEQTAVTPTHDAMGRRLHDLRISVTDKCNFRCPYCMPADRFHENYDFLSRSELLSFEEIVRIARAFAGLGVAKLRITGGEPLMRKGLADLVGMLTEIDGIEDIALTTNGVLLPNYAQMHADAGLQRVTISLDSLDEDVFNKMSGGRASVRDVLTGITAAEDAGLSPIKINCVVQRGVNDHTAVDLAKHFHGTGHIVRFIEYMDVGNCNEWKQDEVVSSRELRDAIHAVHPIVPLDQNYPGEVAKRYAYEDGGGEVGFISSVTAPFCGGCTRARLSANGNVFTCLFASSGTALREALRDGATDGDLRETIAGIWRQRADRYSEERSGMTDAVRTSSKVEMYHIGG